MEVVDVEVMVGVELVVEMAVDVGVIELRDSPIHTIVCVIVGVTVIASDEHVGDGTGILVLENDSSSEEVIGIDGVVEGMIVPLLQHTEVCNSVVDGDGISALRFSTLIALLKRNDLVLG